MTGLRVRQLCAWYQNNNEARDVFWGLSFDVAEGEIVGLVGPNGSGKSTLGRSLLGIHHETTGEILVRGKRLAETKKAYVPQDYRSSFFPWATIRFNLMMLCRRGIRQSFQEMSRLEALVHDFGINMNMRLRPSQCSGGMLQQAAIIRAFWSEPEMLIADEPFSALDVKTADKMRQSFRATVKSKSIACVAILHDPESIAQICDRVLVIPGGPYSSEPIEGYHVSYFLTNKKLDYRQATGKNLSYVELIEGMLQK